MKSDYGPRSWLRLEGLGFSYGNAELFKDFSLDVAEGETVAMTGASGCGKSTLLRLISGLLRPSAGVINLDGEILDDPGRYVEPGRRGIGLVFQDAALFPHLKVSANILFGRPAADPRSLEALNRLSILLELEGLLDRYPHELSGGQQQRVALARALAPEPRLLLLDEAFAGLDRQRKRRVIPELREKLDALGVTVLAVSHDAEEAMLLAKRVVMLDGGKIVQDGSPEELAQKPASPAVEAFFAPLPWA